MHCGHSCRATARTCCSALGGRSRSWPPLSSSLQPRCVTCRRPTGKYSDAPLSGCTSITARRLLIPAVYSLNVLSAARTASSTLSCTITWTCCPSRRTWRPRCTRQWRLQESRPVRGCVGRGARTGWGARCRRGMLTFGTQHAYTLELSNLISSHSGVTTNVTSHWDITLRHPSDLPEFDGTGSTHSDGSLEPASTTSEIGLTGFSRQMAISRLANLPAVMTRFRKVGWRANEEF